jgi:GrpB-like predicted nucleotidyltransferase (UPF0157 family)
MDGNGCSGNESHFPGLKKEAVAMRKVEVIPHQPQWKEMYEKESERLRSVFGDLLVTIYHIGSTAVPELAAKPIIDIMPVVKEIEAVDTLTMQMESLGYTARGENGIPGRRYFYKGESVRTYHVHVFAAGNPEITRHLAFRDYLCHHPIDARRYGELKLKLAAEHPWDIERYIAGKAPLIRELEQKALSWYHSGKK